jgi:hypothetical protein
MRAPEAPQPTRAAHTLCSNSLQGQTAHIRESHRFLERRPVDTRPHRKLRVSASISFLAFTFPHRAGGLRRAAASSKQAN